MRFRPGPSGYLLRAPSTGAGAGRCSSGRSSPRCCSPSTSFAVVGAYLSNQIANNLFQERLAQAESETRYNVKQVQDTFDGAQVTDQSSVITLVYDTLNAVEGRGYVIQRRYVFEAMPEQTKPRNRWVESRASDQLTVSVIPPELRKAVQESGKDQFWASTEFPVGTEDRPGIAVGNKVTFNGTVYELYLIYDLNTAQKTLDEIQNVLLAGGAVLVLMIGAIAWYVTRNVVSPVSHAALVSEKLAAGQLQERMVVKGEDEVARLGASFNHMAASLQEQITQLATLSQMQQRFVSDVSHELRTPLTTVRMAAEVLYDARHDFDPINKRSAELLYNQVERFQSLLADLLEISRFDAGVAMLDAEPTDILQLIAHVIEGAGPVAAEYGSEVTINAPANSIVVEMDDRRIDRILRNLILNALEHGEGKPVNVSVAANGHRRGGCSPRPRDRHDPPKPPGSSTASGGPTPPGHGPPAAAAWAFPSPRKTPNSTTAGFRPGAERERVQLPADPAAESGRGPSTSRRSSWNRPTSAAWRQARRGPCCCWNRRSPGGSCGAGVRVHGTGGSVRTGQKDAS